jgi:hypothetical protein
VPVRSSVEVAELVEQSVGALAVVQLMSGELAARMINSPVNHSGVVERAAHGHPDR